MAPAGVKGGPPEDPFGERSTSVGLLSVGCIPTVVKMSTPQATTDEPFQRTLQRLEIDSSEEEDNDDRILFHRRSSRRAETPRSLTLECAMSPVGSAPRDTCDVEMALQAWGSELSIDPADLSTGACLGYGSTAMVFQGKWRGRAVAVKRLPAKRTIVPIFVRELGVMAQASHPNLVCLLGFCYDGGNVDVVLELCRGDTLYQMLHISDVDVTSRQQVKLASDIADAMAYLHGLDPPVVHRDLKSLNVLLLEPVTSPLDVPTAKVTDFGLAKVHYASVPWGRGMTKGVGTVQWMAPEMMNGGEMYSDKVDVYAYGILLYEIWHFDPPFADLEAHEVEKYVLEGGRPEVDWKSTPEPLVRLIDSCWAQKAKERPTFEAVARSLRLLSAPWANSAP
jgi:hypothetical protein